MKPSIAKTSSCLALAGALVFAAPFAPAASVALAETQGQQATTASEVANSQELPAMTRLSGKVTYGSEAIGLGYSTWASPVAPHLVERDDGSLMRVEALDSELLIENYDSQGMLTNSSSIEYELPVYGGFFAGEDAYYLVVGQNNPKESNSVEVMRVIKYDKSWKRLAACSVRGNNTWKPFEAGSLRMAESDGTLYIHTCHEMYESSDGYHHQANMTFQVDESQMKVTDSFTGVMNLSYGYVSHSFDQYIQTDGKYVYRVDHGDAYPRGIAYTAFPVGYRVTGVTMRATILGFAGETGENATGANLGGFELGSKQGIVVGCTVGNSTDYYGVRNAFLLTTPLAKGSAGTRTGSGYYLTSFESDSKVSAGNPKLVKITADRFLVMWNEVNTETDARTLKIAQVDSEGTVLGDIVSCKADLSDCQPIVLRNGQVVWYASEDEKLVLYALDPDDLQAFSANATAVKDLADTSKAYKNADYQLLPDGTAKLTSVKNVTKSSLVIPASLKANGKSYPVTAFAEGVFAENGRISTLTVKTRKLTKKGTARCLAGSNVKTVKVSVGSKKANKTYVKKYKKFFAKANSGKKVTVR